MDVIPAVDVLNGKAVRLLQGRYDRVSEYSDDPTAVANGFVEAGASLVHVVDLDAARGAEQSLDVLRLLGAAGIPFQVGGGVRTGRAAEQALELGASRVVVGSALLDPGDSASEIVTAVGAERVVAALDVQAGRARGSGWLDEGVELAVAVDRIGRIGVTRALVTGIETDGAMTGPASELFGVVRNLAPDLRMIASGGVGSLDDVRALALSDVGLDAVIVGRALYEGRFSLEAAVEAATVRAGD